MSELSAAPAYAPVAVPMVPLQEPNQRAIGVLAMEALIADARPSPGLAATHLLALESGST
ncbi:hypothetical protein SCANM63S_05078 [Streptomyces canarius]